MTILFNSFLRCQQFSHSSLWCRGEGGIMLPVYILWPLLISTIKWRILAVTYRIICLIARRAYTMTLICQYTIISIFYNAFLLSSISFLKYSLSFNYTYFFILLKLEHIIIQIYTYIFEYYICYLIGCIHFELCKVNGISLMWPPK